MRSALSPLQAATLALAFARGLGEFAALQRWRLRAWMLRIRAS